MNLPTARPSLFHGLAALVVLALFWIAIAIVRVAGGSSSLTITLWLSDRSTSSCVMQMPRPFSTIEISA